MSQPVFKPCRQHQMMLLPPDLTELIPENSMVRVVDSVVDSLDASRLRSLYPGGGSSAYEPTMMLKVVVFAYASGIYSSRKIAQQTRENINFMWLCGLEPLSHNTINRFRSERIRPVFEDIFAEIILLLAQSGYIALDTYFFDGTKIEANANKFSFVWKKSSDRYLEALREKVHAHLLAIDEMEEEEERLAPPTPDDIDSRLIEEVARRINERLAKDPEDKELKKAKRDIKTDYLPRMRKYEHQQDTFEGRGSFSKTDRDATFMRMKDDAMKNGQLKAAYNIQAGTSGQFILDATAHRHPGDTALAIPHLDHVEEKLGAIPPNAVADAGYGSEENYAYLEKKGVEAYVKHNEFFRECKNKKWRTNEMRTANWAYDSATDSYTCPEGRTLVFKGEKTSKSDHGFSQTSRLYECLDCSGCSRKSRCTKSADPHYKRQMSVNLRLSAFKSRASEMLHTEKGSTLRKKRNVEVETVFGDIKHNYGFVRFSLRGLEKVALEFRLVAMGHNMRKLTYAIQKNARVSACACAV